MRLRLLTAHALVICITIAPGQQDRSKLFLREIEILPMPAALQNVRIRSVELLPDLSDAIIEAQDGTNSLIYKLSRTTMSVSGLDPRIDHPGYSEWKQSALARLYTIVDHGVSVRQKNSPGERWIAFISNGIDAEGDVFILELERGRAIRLTSTLENETNVQWSPDGRRLFWTRDVQDSIEVTCIMNAGELLGSFHEQITRFFPSERLTKLWSRTAVEPKLDTRRWKLSGGLSSIQWIGNEHILVYDFDNYRSDRSGFGLIDITNGSLTRRPFAGHRVEHLVPHHTDASFATIRHAMQSEIDLSEIEHIRLQRASTMTVLRSEFSDNASISQALAPASLDGDRFLALESQRENSLCLVEFLRDRIEQSRLVYPSDFDTTHMRILCFDARMMDAASDLVTLFLCIERDGVTSFVTAYMTLPEPVTIATARARRMDIAFGAGIDFVRAIGDLPPGEFHPTGNVRIAATPLKTSVGSLSIGLAAGYASLTRKTSNEQLLRRYYAFGEATLTAHVSIQSNLSPYIRASIGKGYFNQTLSDGSKRMPLHTGVGLGCSFRVGNEMRVTFETMVRKLSIDVDMLPTRNPKKDYFLTVGFGFDYLIWI